MARTKPSIDDQRSVKAERKYELTVKVGKVSGTCWPVGSEPVVIGRDDACTVKILDPVVSRRHCEIKLDHDALLLKDLGSMNPTLVNGEPVAQCVLRSGDEIRIGRVVFCVTEDASIDPAAHSTKEYCADTLPEGQSVYLLDSAVTPRDGSDDNPMDAGFSDLFYLSRSFSRFTSHKELINSLGMAVRERFNSDDEWLLLLQPDGEHWINMRSGTKLLPYEVTRSAEFMRRALIQHSSMLTPEKVTLEGEEWVQSRLAAPVFLGGIEIGVIGLQKICRVSTFSKKDLHFLAALAHVVAPFFKAIERIEQLEVENRRLKQIDETVPRIIGKSKAMEDVRQMVSLVARTAHPVLISGPTGTGKELIAHNIHYLSERSSGPLICVNCAAIPNELFESEVFGHEKGAFTGALDRRVGLIEQSHGGTLFLDEIGDLNPDFQARLLRAVDLGQFRRVGGTTELKVNFRLISATNKDLLAEVQAGRFREDLYHRLKGFEIKVPPLSQRRSDIPELAAVILARAVGQSKDCKRQISPEAMEYVASLALHGNVRELRNVLESALMLCPDEVIGIEVIRAIANSSTADKAPLSLADIERRHITEVLSYTNGHIGKAAQILGVSRTTLYNKFAEYGIERG